MSEAKIKHEGLHSRRLEPDQNNPREVAFAEEWARENSREYSPNVLATLLTRTDGGHPVFPFTGTVIQLAPFDQHAASVAATVVQWLGSNIGMCFIETALAKCGFEIKQRAPEAK